MTTLSLSQAVRLHILLAASVLLFFVAGTAYAQTANVNANASANSTTSIIGGSSNTSSVLQNCAAGPCNQNSKVKETSATNIIGTSTTISRNRIRIRQNSSVSF